MPKPIKDNDMSATTRKPVNVYVLNGYRDRADYIRQLADEYGIDEQTVWMVADLGGENEDFDGLISDLEDGIIFGLI